VGAGTDRVTSPRAARTPAASPWPAGGNCFDKTSLRPRPVARIAAHPARVGAGTKAGYHPTSGWKILGRSGVSRPPVDRYVARVLVRPHEGGAASAYRPTSRPALGAWLVPVAWKGTSTAFRTTAA